MLRGFAEVKYLIGFWLCFLVIGDLFVFATLLAALVNNASRRDAEEQSF